MVTRPIAARVRAYNVGFGDCLLLTFRYGSSHDRNVLFDFGSTKMPLQGGPPSMLAVAEQIAKDCKGKIDVLVVSHRHADHISGFAGKPGEVIATLNPSLVLQPWTEDPELATTADEPAALARAAVPDEHAGKKGFAAELDVMHDIAEQVLRAAATAPQNHGMKPVLEQLAFLGETNIKNHDAVVALQEMGEDHQYASFGTELGLDRLLPGVRVDVLGPPTVKQAPEIRSYATNDENYWSKALRGLSTSALTATSATPGRGKPKPIFPDASMTTVADGPQEARWLIPQVERMQAEEMLALVRDLDKVMNNTSLILTFQVEKDILLFPGDAQLENWSYALRDAPEAAAISARLATTRLYKVGHHGSLNATPKVLLWERFTRKSANPKQAGRLISVMSTAPDKHGHVDDSTEVPRRTLLAELDHSSNLVDTETLGLGDGDEPGTFWRDTAWITF